VHWPTKRLLALELEMVKFGAHFSSVQDPALADTGVPYKRLKKLIDQLECVHYRHPRKPG